MVKTLPDTYIRKAISDAINNMIVDGYTIPCYDTNVVGQKNDYYVILSTQSSEVDRSVKCGYRWESNILIDIITIYDSNGNTGSRLLADNILNKVRELTNNLTLDVASGLEIVTQKQSFPSDLVTNTNNKIVYRKFLRIEFLIN